MSGWHYAPLGATGVIEAQDQAKPETDGGGELAERAELLAHRQAGRRARIRRVATGAAGLAALLVLWQAGAAILHDQVALPSVGQTVAQFLHYLGRPYPAQGKPLWFDLYISLRRILIGFVVGVTIGVAVGAAMSGWRFARHLIDPVIEVIRPLPPLAFIPLFIVWLGIGELPKEVLIIVGVIPIMAVTTVAALDEVPEDLRLCARVRRDHHDRDGRPDPRCLPARAADPGRPEPETLTGVTPRGSRRRSNHSDRITARPGGPPQSVKVGSAPCGLLTRPPGSSQSSCLPRAVRSSSV